MAKKRINIKKIAAEFVLQFVTICIIQGLLFTSLVTSVFTEQKVDRNTASVNVPLTPQASNLGGRLTGAPKMGSVDSLVDFTKKAQSLMHEKKSE